MLNVQLGKYVPNVPLALLLPAAKVLSKEGLLVILLLWRRSVIRRHGVVIVGSALSSGNTSGARRTRQKAIAAVERIGLLERLPTSPNRAPRVRFRLPFPDCPAEELDDEQRSLVASL
jgi:hypothetical protein